MQIRSAVAILAFVSLTTPAIADIADGQGGRTSLQASPHKPAAEAHACCPRPATPAVKAPASPAEVKAIGEVAWAARNPTPSGDTRPCYKRTPTPALVYVSSAELKSLGHLARHGAAATAASVAVCCDSQACPMRKAS